MPDLLKETNQKKIDYNIYQTELKKKKKSPLLWRSAIVLLLVIILIGLGFLTKIVLAINSTNTESDKKVSFFEQIKHLLINPDKELKGEGSNRINILLMGIGGPGHQGAYLADTIIVASIKPSTNEVATISIPRDLYVEIPDFDWRKINNALAFGKEANYPGGGEALLTKVVTQVTGLPIHYYARIDFAGFRKVIDDLGGIDIYVENSFVDHQYPDYNYGYQTISFTKGWEHMSGERALQFVRSRYGTSGEGSDFARSKRQQKVLLAIKEEFFSFNTLINPSSVISALDSLGNHNKTNMEVWEILKFVKLVEDVKKDQLITQVLDTSPQGLLYADTTLDGAYILRPKAGDYSEIQYLAKNIFNASFIAQENARIEIQNSTDETGLAAQTAERLSDMKYNVVKVGNAQVQEAFSKTTIYDLSGGKNPYTLVSLKNLLKADISSGLPAFMTQADITYQTIAASEANSNLNASSTDIDILIVIGSNLVTNAQLSVRSILSLKGNSKKI